MDGSVCESEIAEGSCGGVQIDCLCAAICILGGDRMGNMKVNEKAVSMEGWDTYVVPKCGKFQLRGCGDWPRGSDSQSSMMEGLFPRQRRKFSVHPLWIGYGSGGGNDVSFGSGIILFCGPHFVASRWNQRTRCPTSPSKVYGWYPLFKSRAFLCSLQLQSGLGTSIQPAAGRPRMALRGVWMRNGDHGLSATFHQVGYVPPFWRDQM